MEMAIGIIEVIATGILFRFAKQYGYGEIDSWKEFLKGKK